MTSAFSSRLVVTLAVMLLSKTHSYPTTHTNYTWNVETHFSWGKLAPRSFAVSRFCWTFLQSQFRKSRVVVAMLCKSIFYFQWNEVSMSNVLTVQLYNFWGGKEGHLEFYACNTIKKKQLLLQVHVSHSGASTCFLTFCKPMRRPASGVFRRYCCPFLV